MVKLLMTDVVCKEIIEYEYCKWNFEVYIMIYVPNVKLI